MILKKDTFEKKNVYVPVFYSFPQCFLCLKEKKGHMYFDICYCFQSRPIDSAMVKCESSQWRGMSIVQSTGKKNSRKAWLGALAATVELK